MWDSFSILSGMIYRHVCYSITFIMNKQSTELKFATMALLTIMQESSVGSHTDLEALVLFLNLLSKLDTCLETD